MNTHIAPHVEDKSRETFKSSLNLSSPSSLTPISYALLVFQVPIVMSLEAASGCSSFRTLA